MAATTCLRFVPSRVAGCGISITEVAVWPDRLELLRNDLLWSSYRFWDMAQWPRPAFLWRLVSRLTGWKPRWLPVADRDWFHAPSDRYFSFYTRPTIVVFMPLDDSPVRNETVFVRLQEVLREGGYSTSDLG